MHRQVSDHLALPLTFLASESQMRLDIDWTTVELTEMKCRLLALLALLVIPAVAAPDKVSTCDFKISVRDAETTEGRRIRDGNVRFVVPCVQRDDLAKALATFGVAEPRVREQAQRALGKAQEVTLILTSNMVKE